MTRIEILKKLGSTPERLRQIFSAVPRKQDDDSDEAKQCKKDCEVRKKMEEWFQSTLDDATTRNLSNYKLYAAADIGFDTNPVQPYHIPLNLYAQDKITVQQAAKDVAALGAGEQFMSKDSTGNTKVDANAFNDFVANLVRFVITRRLASRVSRFSTLWPYWKYESRSTGIRGKMYAEFVSQIADIMADDFGHREHVEQAIRAALMYAHTVSFQRCSWECYKEASGDIIEGTSDIKVGSQVSRQGISFELPHITRVFWDFSRPLSALNQDSLEWVGYWDAVPYRSIVDNPEFFNTSSVSFSPTFWDNIVGAYSQYNQQYLSAIKPTLPVVPPPTSEAQQTVLAEAQGTPIDPSSANDQKASSTVYTSNQRDQSVLIAVVYKKIVPVDIGWGTYPFPVTVRFTVAGNNGTVIHAEPMPSRAGAYLGIDVNDSRKSNASLAMQAMPFQEQISRLVTMALMSVISENVKVFIINEDVFKSSSSDGSDSGAQAKIEGIRKQLEAAVRFNDPVVIEASLSNLKESGIDLQSVIHVVETRGSTQTAGSLMEAAFRVLHLMERLLGLSSAEQGQAASHEISATESANIEGTREEIGKLYDAGIDSYRAAMKRLIYESAVSCWQGKMVAPVISRFPKEEVQKAGFEIVEGTEEHYPESNNSLFTLSVDNPARLNYPVIFTSRDGSDRVTQIASANQLVQTLQYLVAFPDGMQALGRSRFYMILNEIFRATNVDVVFEVQPGESDEFGASEIEQVKQAVLQIMPEINRLGKGQMVIEETLKKISPELAEHIRTLLAEAQQAEQIEQQQPQPPQAP